MRIGTMIKQLLEEVRAAPLDDASRSKLREIHKTSIRELEDGLAPELRDELERLTLPFTEDGVPSDAELRIAQAQLVGWLEGLFHGIQTALFAQQMAARQQLEQMRQGALPPGMSAPGQRRARVRPGPGSTCSGGFGGSTAYRDAQRVGGVPHLRREGALAEEGVPRQGGRHDRTQRVQRRRHRGPAGRHHVAGTRRPGGSGRPQRRRQVDAAAAAVGHLRADPRASRP